MSTVSLNLPESCQLEVKIEDRVVFTEQLHIMNDLVKIAQQGFDSKDPTHTEGWTQAFAALLNDKYHIDPPLTSSQACLLAHASVNKWREITQSFFQGLR